MLCIDNKLNTILDMNCNYLELYESRTQKFRIGITFEYHQIIQDLPATPAVLFRFELKYILYIQLKDYIF